MGEQSLQGRQPSPTQHSCIDQISPLMCGVLRLVPLCSHPKAGFTTSSAVRAWLPPPRPGARQCVRSAWFPVPWEEPLCSSCVLSASVHPHLPPGTVVCTHCGCVMLSQSFLFLPPHPMSLSLCPSLEGTGGP